MGLEAQVWVLRRGDPQQVRVVMVRVPKREAGLLWALPIRWAEALVLILYEDRVEQEWGFVAKERKLVAGKGQV